MPRISLLLPTRGRPHLLRRLFDSLAARTDNLDDLEVILYLDDDDETAQAISDDRFSLIKIIGPRLSMGA
jgi:glycosyltransferase involved in cell wall biosynthesis